MTEAETIAVRDCHAAKLHAAALGGFHYDGFSAIILYFALLSGCQRSVYGLE